MENAIFLLVVLIFSAILHEYAHGLAAYSLGDSTAKNMGRLTFNPIPHIDPFYTIILPVMMFILPTPFIIGGAKPVPINPNNLRGERAQMKVALAGPLSNIGLALLFGIFIRFIPAIQENPTLLFAFGVVVFINLLLALFNLLPIPPLDGSHVLFTFFPSMSRKVQLFFAQYGMIVFFLLFFLLFRFIFTFLFIVIGFFFEPLTGISLIEFIALL